MKTVQFNIRMEKKTKKDLELAAFVLEKTQSEIALAAIKKELKKRKELDKRLQMLADRNTVENTVT